jgi:hypothetical protein
MKCYVYEHWRTDTDLCFYVGKGMGPRAYDMNRRSKSHKALRKAILASGAAIEVRIVASDLESPEALLLEAQRIVFWWKSGVPILNLTRAAYSPETLVRMREAARKRGMSPACWQAAKARNTGNKRAPYTEETLAKMRAASVVREQKKKERGYTPSPEARANMRAARARRRWRLEPV